MAELDNVKYSVTIVRNNHFYIIKRGIRRYDLNYFENLYTKLYKLKTVDINKRFIFGAIRNCEKKIEVKANDTYNCEFTCDMLIDNSVVIM